MIQFAFQSSLGSNRSSVSAIISTFEERSRSSDRGRLSRPRGRPVTPGSASAKRPSSMVLLDHEDTPLKSTPEINRQEPKPNPEDLYTSFANGDNDDFKSNELLTSLRSNANISSPAPVISNSKSKAVETHSSPPVAAKPVENGIESLHSNANHHHHHHNNLPAVVTDNLGDSLKSQHVYVEEHTVVNGDNNDPRSVTSSPPEVKVNGHGNGNESSAPDPIEPPTTPPSVADSSSNTTDTSLRHQSNQSSDLGASIFKALGLEVDEGKNDKKETEDEGEDSDDSDASEMSSQCGYDFGNTSPKDSGDEEEDLEDQVSEVKMNVMMYSLYSVVTF